MKTVRDLITAARAAGADHVVYGGSFGDEHVWTTPAWRVAYEPADVGGVLAVKPRLPGARPGPVVRHEQVAEVLVTSAGQAWAVLAALGVLAPAAPDPCPFCARWRRLEAMVAEDARALAGAA